MPNTKIIFCSTERSENDQQLQAYFNTHNEIFITIGGNNNDNFAHVCFDKTTAAQFVKHLKKEIAKLSESSTIKDDNNINNLASRKLKFADTLKPYLEMYGKNLLNDFYAYWTEPNKSNTKFRQELERVWDLKKRLNTWSKNDSTFTKKDSAESQTQLTYVIKKDDV